MPDNTRAADAEPQFYIALVAETRTPGHPNPKTDPRGMCCQLREAFDYVTVVNNAIHDGLSLTFFFTVYAIKSNGEVVAVEDFVDLATARAEWPTAEVRCVTP